MARSLAQARRVACCRLDRIGGERSRAWAGAGAGVASFRGVVTTDPTSIPPNTPPVGPYRRRRAWPQSI